MLKETEEFLKKHYNISDKTFEIYRQAICDIEEQFKEYDKIREIIEKEPILTQEALADALRQQNIEVTQATVSRDIKELMLVKITGEDGLTKYALPQEKEAVVAKSRMERLFKDTVIKVDYSENIVVIKTLPGAANAVASTIDNARWPEIIGTVAGDDNIIAVVKPKDMVAQILARLQQMLM